MQIRGGFDTFEFKKPSEVAKPLGFVTEEHALKFLKQVGGSDASAVRRLREYAESLSEMEPARLTDEEGLQKLAQLLFTRRIVVFRDKVKETRGGAGTAVTAPVVAFPFAERVRSNGQTATTPPAKIAELPTFSQTVNPAAVATALRAAAAEGAPFCSECQKASTGNPVGSPT